MRTVLLTTDKLVSKTFTKSSSNEWETCLSRLCSLLSRSNKVSLFHVSAQCICSCCMLWNEILTSQHVHYKERASCWWIAAVLLLLCMQKHSRNYMILFTCASGGLDLFVFCIVGASMNSLFWHLMCFCCFAAIRDASYHRRATKSCATQGCKYFVVLYSQIFGLRFNKSISFTTFAGNEIYIFFKLHSCQPFFLSMSPVWLLGRRYRWTPQNYRLHTAL